MLQALDPDFALRPHDTWDALRGEDPVRWVEELPGWVVTGYPEVRDALRHPDLSSSPRYSRFAEPPDPAATPTTRQRFFESGLFNVAPDDHVRLRRLVSRAFTPQGVQAQQARTRELVAERLDRFGPGDEVDLVADLYADIPPRVIANLIGLPPSLSDEFRAMADVLTLTIDPSTDAETDRRIDEVVVEAEALFLDLAEQRRRAPADDLLTRLLEVEEDGDRLRRDELVSLLFAMVIAGSGTTANFLAMATVVLLDHPGALARLHREPATLPPALEELLRVTCFGFGMPRFAVSDATLAGREIAAGDLLVAVIPAANTDPAAYADPRRYDPDRQGPPHLSFSIGAHHCLGASLARLEAATVLGELTGRFGDLELTGEPELEASFLFRDVRRLPVRLGAPAPAVPRP